MAICLVANIPNQLIVRGIINIMKRYGKFNNAQAGPKMASMNADNVYNVLP
jgi:hypothetical protein